MVLKISKKSDLILGTAWNYQPKDILPFVESWKKYCKPSRLILVVNPDLPPETMQFLNDYGIEAKVFTAGHYIADSIGFTRYLKYLDILCENMYVCDGILLTDVRDVVFQSNPFNSKTRKGLHVFYEDESVLIGEQEFNRNNMLLSYGQSTLNELHESRVICSGTTLGDWDSITNYIVALINQRRLSTIQDHYNLGISVPGIDQALHQYLIYKNIIQATIHENGDIVSTIALTPEEQITLLPDSTISVYNKVSPIVHQWDRHSFLVKHLYDQYS